MDKFSAEKNEKKKKSNGFGLRLTQAIIYLAFTVMFFIVYIVQGPKLVESGAPSGQFVGLALFFAFLATLNFIFAFNGKKSISANTACIVINSIFILLMAGLSAFGISGGVKGRNALGYKEMKAAKKAERAQLELKESNGSTFTGGAFANAGINILTGFVCLITLGLAYPAMVCWKLRWKCSHTYINGRQLAFDGKGIQLFGKYVLWLLLSIITLGIYYIVSMKISIAKWQTKHTHFADTVITEESENLSVFDGHWYQLLGVNWLCNFVTAITLSFGRYWAHCYRERWFCKHKKIDGLALTFDGKAVQYFGKKFCWTLLTVITLGIYAFWLAVKTEKWTCSHTHIKENND